jgi:hypothetical protein
MERIGKNMQNKIEEGRNVLRNLSHQDFLAFGVNQLAYIKPVSVMGRQAFTLHGADGAPLAVIDSFEGAVIAARQNDMEPIPLQ